MPRTNVIPRPIVMRRVIARGAVAVVALGVGGCLPSGDEPHPQAAACEALGTLEHGLAQTEVTLAELVPAGGLAFEEGAAPLDLPALCRVQGRIEPQIQFEVWLPAEGWNGRYQGVGNGGMAGTISYPAMARALSDGYATASTDTGHQSSGVPFDATWANDHPELIDDFGHRSLHLTTVAGKKLTELFYGEPAHHAYYVGCSKGGQQGLMEAQRYPDDFDGILAGNPANDWTRFYAGAHLWYSLALLRDEESWIPPAGVQLLGDAVNAACDGLDGIEDGVLSDPTQCTFDPSALLCEGGATEGCLTAKQVQAVKDIWAGARDSEGNVIFPGLVPGGEASPGGWALWVTGPEPFRSLHWLAGEGFFRHMVFGDPDWDFRTFDFDRDLPLALERVGAQLDSADPNLAPLRDRGSKLLVYHGLSDADISPLGSTAYYDRVVDHLADGAPAEEALASTQDFFRLFLVPGMGHCRGGPGYDTFDALGALEAWVEEGVAPQSIEARRMDDQGNVLRTRPLCPYPQKAVYDGSGDPDAASSFRCEAP